MLSSFSSASWPPVCLLWRNVSLDLCPFFIVISLVYILLCIYTHICTWRTYTLVFLFNYVGISCRTYSPLTFSWQNISRLLVPKLYRTRVSHNNVSQLLFISGKYIQYLHPQSSIWHSKHNDGWEKSQITFQIELVGCQNHMTFWKVSTKRMWVWSVADAERPYYC